MEKTTNLNFKISASADVPHRIVIFLDGTGLDIDQKEHLEYLKDVVETVAIFAYALTHNVSPAHVKL